jgi:hypothetical protein
MKQKIHKINFKFNNPIKDTLPGAYPKYEAFSPTKGLERFSSPMVVVGP